MKKSKIFTKPKSNFPISFYNRYLTDSVDLSRESEYINDSFNNSFNLFYYNNNPLLSTKNNNKSKKELILAKLDTSNLTKKKINKKEQKDINNKTMIYDDSDGLLMAAKLSSSFMTDKSIYGSNIYYKKKKIRYKNGIYNLYNNVKKEKNYISVNDIFGICTLDKYNNQIHEISKIQSLWRRYYIRKIILIKIHIIKFIKILHKIIYKKIFHILLYNNIILEKIYNKKLIKKNNSFKINELQIEKKINEIIILDNNKRNIKNKINNGKYINNKNYWIQLPFSIEKYIKKQNNSLYSNFFFEKFKIIYNKQLKEKQKILLKKLIYLNNNRNLKTNMKKYKEKILVEKTKQYIYHSLIKTKPEIKSKNFNIFNFQYFYKQNILRDIIKKFRYTSIIQKYYFLWKKKINLKIKKIEKKKKNSLK